MTGRQRRYLSAAIGVACGLAIAIAIVGLLEPFGGAPQFGRIASGETDPKTAAAPPTEAGRESAVMSLHDTPRAVPELRFDDGNGKPVTLADFRGKVVLLNIWATWCGPCREEMPTLDRLQARLGGPAFEVVALSIDRAGIGVVTAFYDEIGIEHLAKYIDEGAKAAGQLKAVGLPTTLLIDREGREIGRHVGPAEWDTPEMVAFFEQQITRSSSASWTGRASKWAGHPAGRSIAPSSRLAVPGLIDPDPSVTDATRSSAFTGGKPS